MQTTSTYMQRLCARSGVSRSGVDAVTKPRPLEVNYLRTDLCIVYVIARTKITAGQSKLVGESQIHISSVWKKKSMDNFQCLLLETHAVATYSFIGNHPSWTAREIVACMVAYLPLAWFPTVEEGS